MVNLHHVLRRVRDELLTQLDAPTIFQHCRQVGHQWRSSPLNPAMLVRLFIMQQLEGNTACSHLRLLTDLSFSASAYCQARRRLPRAVIVALARHVAQTVQQVCDCHGRWHGHRLCRIDGTGVSMPDTPSLRECFGQPSVQPQGCGFPVASLVVRTHAGTGMLLDLFIGPLVRHEMTSVPRMHERLQAGDVLVPDRGFCSYAHLGLVIQRGLHAVFRQHQRKKVSFKRGPGRRRDMPARQRSGRPNTQLVRVLGPEDQVCAISSVHRPGRAG